MPRTAVNSFISRPLSVAIRACLAGMAAVTACIAMSASAAQPNQVAESSTTVLPTVQVEGAALASDVPPAYAGGQIARGGRLGVLGNADTMKTPLRITSFTDKEIENQQARSIADIVKKDPSVRSVAPGSDVADAFFVRGFALGDGNIGEIAFDGLYGVAPNYRLFTEYAERIEVLKGPSAMVYGISPNSSIGGAINVVPKRWREDLSRVTLDYSEDSVGGVHADIARRIGGERTLGVRLNAGYRSGDTAIDHQSVEAAIGSLALDYQVDRLRVTLDLIDQHDEADAPLRRPFLTAGLAVPKAPDNQNNITQSWEWYESHETSGLLKVEYDLSELLTVFASYGQADSEVQRLFNTPVIFNEAGDTRVQPRRATFDIERQSGEIGLHARFATGSLNHQVTLQGSEYQDRYSMGSVSGSQYTSNIYVPVESPRQVVAGPATVPKLSNTTFGGGALADNISLFNDTLQILLGVRYQTVEANNFLASGARNGPRYDESKTAPLAGFVVQPSPSLSFYGNYSEGITKDLAPATAVNAGQVFVSTEANQVELGVKFDAQSVLTEFALFEIERPNGQVTSNVYALDAEQRNRGAELSVAGELTSQLRLYGGVTWIDAELTETNNIATQGNTAVGVPELQAQLSMEWDLPWLTGLTLTAAALHSSEQYADQANRQEIPAWTSYDVGARYSTDIGGRAVILRALLRNVTDKDYWAGSSSYGTLVQAEPRTLSVSATIDF